MKPNVTQQIIIEDTIILIHILHIHNDIKKEKTTPMLPPPQIMVYLHFCVGPSLYVILKRAVQDLEGP